MAPGETSPKSLEWSQGDNSHMFSKMDKMKELIDNMVKQLHLLFSLSCKTTYKSNSVATYMCISTTNVWSRFILKCKVM